jgi:hypothetical protein
MKRVEPTRLHSASARAVPDADLLELSDGHHAVLAGRKHRDEGIQSTVGEFSSHLGR